jgi:hypothetical protein
MVLKKIVKSVRELRTGGAARDKDAHGHIIVERLRELTKPAPTKMPPDTGDDGEEPERKKA